MRPFDATKRQPEYGKPFGDYINMIVSLGRVTRGQAKEREWRKAFDAVEKRFQVERWVLIALWGMETDFGSAKDKWDVFRSLSTLGYIKYRHPFFRDQLFIAMKIMQDNKFPREKMVSSCI
jgi:membrane-bound lytic murein transglycosylase B